MSKKQHPIRKMQRAIRRASAYESRPDEFVDAVAARHVKPLLDALAIEHGNAPCDEVRYGSGCTTCRLLAEWRAPLT